MNMKTNLFIDHKVLFTLPLIVVFVLLSPLILVVLAWQKLPTTTAHG